MRTVLAGTWLTFSQVELGRHAMAGVYIVQAAAQFLPMSTRLLSDPSAFESVTSSEATLFWMGMGTYLVGSQVYANKTCDLWPRTFGYHEVWHCMVVFAQACTWHTNSMLLLRIPAA